MCALGTGVQTCALPISLGAAWNWPLSIACGLARGALVGLWQGLWVAYGGVPDFVVTLGGLLIFRGAAFEITDGRTVAPLDPTYQHLCGGIGGAIGANENWGLRFDPAPAVGLGDAHIGDGGGVSCSFCWVVHNKIKKLAKI